MYPPKLSDPKYIQICFYLVTKNYTYAEPIMLEKNDVMNHDTFAMLLF